MTSSPPSNILHLARFRGAGRRLDWDNLTLGVFYSSNNFKLTAVAGVLPNPTVSLGSSGLWKFGVRTISISYATQRYIY